MLKFISFDLDGTLVDENSLDYTLWFEEIPRLYARQHGISLGKAKQRVFKEYFSMDENKKEWTMPSFWLKKFKLKSDRRKLLRSLSKLVRLFPESRNVLGSLSKRYRLVVLSKSSKELLDLKMKVEGIDKYFHRVFCVPHHFNTGKKGTSVYKSVLRKLRCKPHEIIHIGDDFVYDYLTPRKLGIRAIFLDRRRKPGGRNTKRILIIRNLKEIEKHLEPQTQLKI